VVYSCVCVCVCVQVCSVFAGVGLLKVTCGLYVRGCDQ